MPALVSEFGDSVRLIVQVRHPFDAAASHAIKGAYHDLPEMVEWSERCFLRPWDKVFHPEVGWQVMTPFEKALWRWSELVLYGRELRDRYPSLECQFVRAEDLFRETSAFSVYFRACGLTAPPAAELHASVAAGRRNETRADLQHWFGLRTEWRRYYDYPWIVDLAAEFGYASDIATIRGKAKRYAKPLGLVRRTARKLLSHWVR